MVAGGNIPPVDLKRPRFRSYDVDARLNFTGSKPVPNLAPFASEPPAADRSARTIGKPGVLHAVNRLAAIKPVQRIGAGQVSGRFAAGAIQQAVAKFEFPEVGVSAERLHAQIAQQIL